MNKSGLINAVHDDDLKEFLDSIGELDKFINGKICCVYCDVVITTENIQSIFPHDGEVAYCCNSINCQEKLYSRR